jgi:hypothetical protein
MVALILKVDASKERHPPMTHQDQTRHSPKFVTIGED